MNDFCYLHQTGFYFVTITFPSSLSPLPFLNITSNLSLPCLLFFSQVLNPDLYITYISLPVFLLSSYEKTGT